MMAAAPMPALNLDARDSLRPALMLAGGFALLPKHCKVSYAAEWPEFKYWY